MLSHQSSLRVSDSAHFVVLKLLDLITVSTEQLVSVRLGKDQSIELLRTGYVSALCPSSTIYVVNLKCSFIRKPTSATDAS